MYQRILVATDGSELSRKAVPRRHRPGGQPQGAAGRAARRAALSHRLLRGRIAVCPDEVARIEKQWADNGQALVDAVERRPRRRRRRPRPSSCHSDLVAETIISHRRASTSAT
jgi:nucleotide-binding universal stress UspA family protein